ncbi:MAG TPA: ribosome small subunit-dependent GTPase A [Acidobacteriota bacterium]|nr:ribosome small subunit-dependent GTPase A [Acidobacteriota bacterium]
MTLAALGWTDELAAAFAPHAAVGLSPARVTLQLKGFWEVTTPDTARLAQCTGKFLAETGAIADMPAVGDWVAIEALPGDDTRALIHAVLPRRTKFSRKAAGERDVEQVVAANIDTVFLVSSLDANFNLRRIERYLAAARASGAQPVIVLNKSDLTREAAARRAEVEAIGRGTPIVVTSALKRGGTKPLREWLKPQTTVAFLGSSGVGKSTLINELVGEELLATQEIRDIDGKGRHTTTLRELVVSPEGVLIIDTPGMRELQPWQADEAVEDVFADIRELTLHCKFSDCSHTTEPGCAVQTALADGTLDPSRWQSYQRLQRETAFEVRRVDRRASQKHKNQWKKIIKDFRQRVREEQRGED